MFPLINTIYKHILQDIKITKISDQDLTDLDGLLTLGVFSDGNGNILYRKNIRNGNLVDQFWTDKYIDYYNKNIIFTHWDCIGDNVINVPLGFMPHKNISQDIDYYKMYNPNPQYHNKIFWRGRGFTHSIRGKIIDFLKAKQNNNIDIDYWRPKGNPYGPIKPVPLEYTNYFSQLQNADMFLTIRGDLPWLNSFFDAIRAGCIPVCIDTFYGKLGWENIGIAKEDILLDFNTDVDSLDYIYTKIIELLSDKNRILYMKNNIINFYQKYILTDLNLKYVGTQFHFSGWADFYVAKALEVAHNNYTITDSSFICSRVKEIKNL